MMRSFCRLMMIAFQGLTYKYCTEHGENKSLKKSYQHFDQVDKYGKSN